MRRPVLTLLLLSLVTFFLGLGRPAITDSDEAFYAEAAREMVESGDWLTPRFNYEDRWQKPVLYYWLTAAAFLVAGPTETAARWWAALSGLGLVLLTWAAAGRITSSSEIAWLAGAIVATCFGCFAMARVALPDLPLAFFITAAVWMAVEERWLLAGLAAGLGFLTKGPLALAVPAVILLPVWWRERRDRLPGARGIASAAIVFALVGLPWFVAMTAEHGAEYLQSFFIADNLERFATDRFNEPRPVWFYLPILAGGLLPWSAYLLTLPWASIVRPRRERPVSREDWLLAMWICLPLLLFTISVGKQPRYILAVLPPLAIVVARAISSRIQGDGPADRRMLGIATWGTTVLFIAAAMLLLRARPAFVGAHPFLTILGSAVLVGSAALLAWTAALHHWRALPHRMTIAAVGFLLAVQFGALAGLRPEPVEEMAALIGAHRGVDEPVGVYQVFVRNLLFYTRSKQVVLYDETHARDFLNSAGRVLLVVRKTDLPRLEELSDTTLKRLGEVRYMNAADVRLRSILTPDPVQDIQTVLLVANR